MKKKVVGIREFRMNLKKIINSGEEVIVSSNGLEIGKFVPRFKLVKNKEYDNPTLLEK